MKILVADDDLELRGILAFVFRQAGYFVIEAPDGQRALGMFRAEAPDLVVLDVNMPGVDGFEVCRRIRAASTVPILMLTVRGQEADVVSGLDAGADDYMAKPFRPQSLLARVRALLRRARMETSQEQSAGDLALDLDAHRLTIAGRAPVRLTRLQLRLLQILLANADRPVRAERLFAHVWGSRGGGDRHLLKQLVHRVRRKIEAHPQQPVYLLTESGIGYRLNVTGLPPGQRVPSADVV